MLLIDLMATLSEIFATQELTPAEIKRRRRAMLAALEMMSGATSNSGGQDVSVPNITSPDAINNGENSILAHLLTANEAVTWSIVGGADQTRFELAGSTLRWIGNGTKDYENPNDADTNNTYVVIVRATDGAANTSNQTITVTVTDVSEGTSTAGQPIGLLLVLTKAA